MKKRLAHCAACCASLILAMAATPAIAAGTCESLGALALSQTTITAAQSLPAGTYTAPDGEVFTDLPAFCRVAATLTPSSDSNIRIEVWMPSAGWNGKYEGTGNGGYAGTIIYNVLADGLQRGYAVANTDMGTSPATTLDGSPLVGHPEKWKDWGYRATHVMTVAAKDILRAFYGRHARRSYFTGCSTGGEQALMEAQRFPDDYDGIVGGDPGHNRTHLHTAFVWSFRAAQLPPGSVLPFDKLALLNSAVLAACGAQDGALKADGFLNDPRDCHFDPKSLQCTGADAPTCLTASQAEAAALIYDGPRNPSNHHLIYPGWPRGSEGIPVIWPFLEGLISTEPAFDGLFKWVFGANWDWRTFDFDRDMAIVDAQLGPILNATNPDLGTFKRRGGKLILYHGTADAIVAPQDTINYYNEMVALAREGEDEGRAPVLGRTLEETQDFARLFLVPGMSHCGGGPGPNVFNGADNLGGPRDSDHDVFSALDRWVTEGLAPERIVATKYVNDNPAAGVAMTRPLCVYPKLPHYEGAGDTSDAANFVCRTDEPDVNEVPAPEYSR
jgi:feruloyl esterase